MGTPMKIVWVMVLAGLYITSLVTMYNAGRMHGYYDAVKPQLEKLTDELDEVEKLQKLYRDSIQKEMEDKNYGLPRAFDSSI